MVHGCQIVKLFHCYKTNSELPVERFLKSLGAVSKVATLVVIY